MVLFMNFQKCFFLRWSLGLHVFSVRCCLEDKWIWMSSLLYGCRKRLSFCPGSHKGAWAQLLCPPVLTKAPAGSLPPKQAQLSLLHSFGWKGKTTMMLSEMSFPIKLWFSQLGFMDFNILKLKLHKGLCKCDGKQEEKYHRSLLCFRPGWCL